MTRWPRLFAFLTAAEPTPLERAEAEAAAKLDCQSVGRARKAKDDLAQRATNNGLLACVDAEARARISNALCLADKAAERVLGSSQSHPVPGRHRAARNLKLSTHGGAK